ncbi:MAG: SGNH/GDSL hydrolase family protein [Xanthomonadales bacterium]|nr:SGNH/GDSL hydrolase family protein [Xanthomonadales bacterium]
MSFRPWLLMAILLLSRGAGALEAADGGAASMRILFIGNSLTYSNDLPGVVEALGAADGLRIETLTKAKPDFGLSDHWADRRTRAALAAGNWDYVVMQQGPSSLPANQVNLSKWAQRWAEPIRKGGAQPALFMVWPPVSRLQAFAAVDDAYSKAAEDAQATLLPAGRAWWAAWQLEPGPALYGGDGFHPDPMGTALAALVIYAGLSGQLPERLPDELPVGVTTLRLSEDQAQVLLQAAATALALPQPVDRDLAQPIAEPSH